MLSPVSAVDATSVNTESAASSRRQETPTLADKVREAGMALERTKRDLASAQLRAEREERLIADARREMENVQWLNANSDRNAAAERLAAASLASQSAVIDSAMKAGADTSAQILRLQNRIERQTTRYFDLQKRAQSGDAPGQRPAAVAAEQSRDDASPRRVSQTPFGEPQAGSRREPQETTRREEKWDIRDFAAQARRAWIRRTAKAEAPETA